MGNGYSTILLLEVSTQRNCVADFIRLKLNFIQQTKNHFLSHPLGDLGVTYALHLQLIGKPVVDFLFVIIELFSLSLTVETLYAKICQVSIFKGGGSL